MNRTITRILALSLCLLCLFSFVPLRHASADGAFPENVTIQSEKNNAFDYLEYYSGGKWKDLNTPRHWIEQTGQVCYCIEHAIDLINLLGLSRTTVYYMLRADDFPTILIGNRRMVRKDRLFQWLDEHETSKR